MQTMETNKDLQEQAQYTEANYSDEETEYYKIVSQVLFDLS